MGASLPVRARRPARDPAASETSADPALARAARERWSGAPRRSLGGQRRVLNVPADVYDLRDRRYVPMLHPLARSLDNRRLVPRVRDQGEEGSCTGFAMYAVVNVLMRSRRRDFEASPRFLYENARRYDEWKGQDYEGSSIRGAMKGFHKHGVCSWKTLPYVAGRPLERLPRAALDEAADKPLGAYFRVTTSSVNDLQSALNEAGIVLASAQVHDGWDAPTARRGGLARIEWKPAWKPQGGHAFALVGYTDEGFILQNSWGRDWGSGGFALLTYEDWLRHRMDAWVAQLGIGRVRYGQPATLPSAAAARTGDVSEGEIRGHYVAIENGRLDTYGTFRTLPGDLASIAERLGAFARDRRAAAASPVKVMLWAHGGLVGEDGAASRARDLKPRLLEAGVFPIHFFWHTGFAEEVNDLLFGKHHQAEATPGEAPVKGWLKDKLQDAKDGILELAARPLGRPIWNEMKSDARDACRARDGSPGPAFALLDTLRATGLPIEWHLVGHSAGSILHCRLFEWFVRHGVRVKTLTFLAPAVTTELFRATVIPHDALLGTFALHAMTDHDERTDHCGEVPGTSAGIYHKSLLYLVSCAFEDQVPQRILGLARHVHEDHRGDTRDTDRLVREWLAARARCHWHRPALERPGATLHGSFDDDPETLQRVIERIAGAAGRTRAPARRRGAPPRSSRRGRA
jgi:hypothetical protein